MDAGEMRERVTILDLTNVGSDYQWTDGPTVWAKVELTGKTNLFSKVGIGARDVTITMRHRPLSLHQAIRWRGRHLFLTEILPPVGGYMEIKAAVVDVRMWKATRYKTGIDRDKRNKPLREPFPPFCFPGVVTEKYLGHTPPADDGHATTEVTYVLVIPKAVALASGDLVSNLDTDAAGTYVVTVSHCLDEHKNEHEIYRKGDV